jgi:hypothetical protein
MLNSRLSKRVIGLLAALVACGVLLGVAAAVDAASDGASGLTPPPALPLVSARLELRAPRVPVPRSFLGLSTEYWTLPQYGNPGVFERVLALVHASGDGPLVLRIGGDSSDHVQWLPQGHASSDWVYPLTPQWLAQTASIVRDAHLRVILDLNGLTSTPAATAAWTHAALTAMPPGSVVGLEVGNEDDIYSQRYWLDTVGRDGPSLLLPRHFSAARYLRLFAADAGMAAQVAPGIPLLGPALAEPVRDRAWISLLLARERRALGEVSAHRYPYSACASPLSGSYPTIHRVLSEHASAGLAARLHPLVALAHRAGKPFRLSELNSVTCGGRPGVSDTFATALWAPDVAMELLRAGVNGINFHVRAHTVNAPFALSPQGLRAHPLLYGLILTARTIGSGGALLALQLHVPATAHVKAWAVRVRDGTLDVLVLDKGPRAVRFSLSAPGWGGGSVQRLLAPGVSARNGVTLAGQWLDRSGRWQGRAQLAPVRLQHGRLGLTMPRFSAALLTLAPTRRSAIMGRDAARRHPPQSLRRRGLLAHPLAIYSGARPLKRA